ncbi:hypothetical protein AUG86_02495 [Euryarchaeota archaeon 13_1_20CM_4_64_14]|nr:MAG: hypothetical protein AUG86_02495 [Euryarchaeota archaeon 13_1_20CM_4_64_14]
MDENERITLRLEKENLELIDAFLKGSTSHGNRSQLVRDAVQAYIQTIREGGDTVKIRIPRYYLELIDRLVADAGRESPRMTEKGNGWEPVMKGWDARLQWSELPSGLPRSVAE